MQLQDFSRRRLIAAATIGCAAALAPAAALAATTSSTAAQAAPASHVGSLGSPAGGPGRTAATVPADFQPVSASFYTPAAGVVLGTVGCRPQQACKARLVATTDDGARWHVVTAPEIRLPDPAGASRAPEVSSVVFVSRRVGWLYGPGLWVTRDGGARWRRITLHGNIRPARGGGVAAMAVSAGIAYAVVSPDPFSARPEELYASPVGRDAWARVGTMTGDPFAILAVSGKAAWFGTSTDLWTTTDGMHWHRYQFRCPGGAYYELSSIAAASSSHVTFLCTGNAGMGQEDKELLSSANGGRTMHLVGRPPSGGVGGALSVPPGRATVITLADEYFVYRSADSGRSWKVILVNTGGGSWSSLAYVSKTVGWAVQNGTSTGPERELLRTSDSGATWQKVSF